jgi:multidrug efflux pump subunit AcrA (membrane-fusion protein)
MPVRSALPQWSRLFAVGGQAEAAKAQVSLSQINLDYTDIRSPIAGRVGRTSETQGNIVSPTPDVLTTIVSQDPMRSARGVARTASQIDLQLLELGDGLIDALLPFLAQRFPDLRR